VLDAATGKPLGDSIDRILYGSIAWRPDGQSFFYNRLQVMKPGMAENEREQNEHTFLHVLGQSAERDVEFLGHGVSARVPMTGSDQASVSETSASPYAIAFVYGESTTDVAVYVAPTQSVTGPNAPWRRIADFSDRVSGAAQRGSQLYLLEHKRSSRFAIDVMDLDRPGAAQPFIDPSNAVIRDFTLAKDGLYTHDLDGGVYHLRRRGYAPGAATETVALPFLGSVDGVNSDPRYTGIQFELENWTQPPAWYHAVAPSSVVDLNLVTKPAVSFDDYTAEEVQAKSADGTMIPLSIVHRKGIALDGSHPLLLSGYGSYGVVEDATFSPRSLALLERGAVVATAHVRGGGEYGEDWHTGGQKGNKKNTWLDFIACAQYLIDHKYTSHEHIAAEGGSAGGITVGRAITTDPKLFAAAIIDVGWENVTRIAQERNGPANFPEFGSPATEEGFRWLYDMDSYLHVQDGTAYPAVLFTTGINDRRVASWHPAKMTARLQAASSSGKPILLRVDYDLGHSQGATKQQINDLLADSWSFMLWQTGDPAFQPGAQTKAADR
jgi:prolyl oligopeptidase